MAPSVALSTAASTSPPSAAAAALPGLGQTALSLIVVLGLIFALAWVLKRLQGVRTGGPANLRIHGGLQVGAKEKVLLIEAGGTHLLIGVSASGVSTLHVYPEAPAMAVAEVPSAGSGQPPMATAFAEALKRALGQPVKS